jgi:hypothetical protein
VVEFKDGQPVEDIHGGLNRVVHFGFAYMNLIRLPGGSSALQQGSDLVNTRHLGGNCLNAIPAGEQPITEQVEPSPKRSKEKSLVSDHLIGYRAIGTGGLNARNFCLGAVSAETVEAALCFLAGHLALLFVQSSDDHAGAPGFLTVQRLGLVLQLVRDFPIMGQTVLRAGRRA